MKKKIVRMSADRKSETKYEKERSPESEITLHEVNFVKKPKQEISLPSWRRVDVARRRPGKTWDLEEDLSDEAFIRRHEAAEAEEQILWDKWRVMREEQGKRVTGRSTLGGWRTSDLGVGAPRLRSQRLDSARSEASSTPGRLSPASMDRVKEICVLSQTPTKVTVHSINKTSLAKSLHSSQNLNGPNGQKRKSVESSCQKESDISKRIKQSEISTNVGDEQIFKRFRRSTSSKVDQMALSNSSENKGSSGSKKQTTENSRILKESNIDKNAPLSQKQRRYCNFL